MTQFTWKKVILIEKIISILLTINIILVILNNENFFLIFYSDLINYFFWLSLGIYIGFKLCKKECFNSQDK